MTLPHRGITLVECLVTMAVVVALAGIAAPAYSSAQARTHVALLQSELVDAIAHATRMSVVTGSHVVLCAGGEACSNSSDWSEGWMAFIDIDGDRTRGSTEPALLHRSRLAANYRVISSAGRPSVVFNMKGATPGSNTTFTICDVAGRTQAQSLVIANSGRLRKLTAGQANADACRNASTR